MNQDGTRDATPARDGPALQRAGIGDLPDGTSRRKVLLLDLDGVRWDKLQEAATPTLDGLAAVGRLTPTQTHGTEVAPPVSGPGHATILTGVWPTKHGVTDNAIEPHDLAHYPDLLTRLKTVRSSLSTFAVGDWPPLLEQIIDRPDVKVLHPEADGGSRASLERTVAWSAELLHTRNPDVGYVYVVHVDSVGHARGGASPEYLAAIEEVDAAVGTILDAVRTRPTYAEEDWLVLVATDHGHTDTGGHGGDEPEVRGIWTLAAGGDIRPGRAQRSSGAGTGRAQGAGPGEGAMVDIAPTAFAHLGIDLDPSWDLDGVPLQKGR